MTARAPLTEVAEEVRFSILPRRIVTKESIGSTSYSSWAGEPRSISSSGAQVFAVWSSVVAVTCTSGVRLVAHGTPTGWPAASHPSHSTGPMASTQQTAATNGLLPHPRGRERTARDFTRLPVSGSSS